RGPIDGATTINSFADYERGFGGVSLDSPMSYAVRDFYLNGGSQGVIVRVHNGATAARISLGAGGGTLELEAASVGSWGNALGVLVDHDTKDTTNPSLFNLTLIETNPITRQATQTEKFLNVSVSSSNPRYVVRVLEQESNLV